MRDLLAVLAEPNRRRIVELLGAGELSVNELASRFSVTRSAISQHLRVLATAGLVASRQEGRLRYYSLVPGGVASLRASLDAFWSNELDDLAASAAQLGSAQRTGRRQTMPVHKTVLVPLGAAETFALLTEPERLRRWQAITARIDLRAGGDYRWTIIPGHTAAGQVLEVEPGKRLVLSWGWEDDEAVPPGSSRVTITLEPTDGGTMVDLIHEGLPEQQAEGHAEGWDHYCERLVAAAGAASGDAGPDEWAAVPDPIDKLKSAEAALAVCQSVLRSVRETDVTAATPCTKFTVADLLEHLLGSLSHLAAMAGSPMEPLSVGSFEERVAAAGQHTVEAWRTRGLDGTVQFGPNTIPADLAVNILSIELLVHAWDFAQATSQAISVSDEVGEYVLGLATVLIRPELRDGDRFGEALEAGPDAEPLERLAAFTGRAA